MSDKNISNIKKYVLNFDEDRNKANKIRTNLLIYTDGDMKLIKSNCGTFINSRSLLKASEYYTNQNENIIKLKNQIFASRMDGGGVICLNSSYSVSDKSNSGSPRKIVRSSFLKLNESYQDLNSSVSSTNEQVIPDTFNKKTSVSQKKNEFFRKNTIIKLELQDMNKLEEGEEAKNITKNANKNLIKKNSIRSSLFNRSSSNYNTNNQATPISRKSVLQPISEKKIEYDLEQEKVNIEAKIEKLRFLKLQTQIEKNIELINTDYGYLTCDYTRDRTEEGFRYLRKYCKKIKKRRKLEKKQLLSSDLNSLREILCIKDNIDIDEYESKKRKSLTNNFVLMLNGDVVGEKSNSDKKFIVNKELIPIRPLFCQNDKMIQSNKNLPTKNFLKLNM
jgi:hypothetical protein